MEMPLPPSWTLMILVGVVGVVLLLTRNMEAGRNNRVADPSHKHSSNMKDFWFFAGIGLMFFLLAVGIGGCIALGDGRIQIKYDNTVNK